MALSEWSSKLGLALDVRTQAKAKPILKQLADSIGTIKFHAFSDGMGLKEAVKFLRPYKKQLFWDPKLDDVDGTMILRLQEAIDLGVDFVTVHASAGLGALKAATELAEGSKTKILAVTLLTSLDESAVRSVFNANVEKKQRQFIVHIHESKPFGIVCGVPDLPIFRSHSDTQRSFLVTPGIRLQEAGRNSEARNGTPEQAIRLGSDLLIVGGALLSAKNRVAVASAILRDIEKASEKEEPDALWPLG